MSGLDNEGTALYKTLKGQGVEVTGVRLPIEGQSKLVPVPSYLAPHIAGMTRRRRFVKRTVKGLACYACGVNWVGIKDDNNAAWVKSNVCSRCPATIPFIGVSVTELLDFDTCEQLFNLSRVQGIARAASSSLLLGSVMHLFEQNIVALVNSRKYSDFKKLYPDKEQMFAYVKQFLEEQYDSTATSMVRRAEEDNLSLDKGWVDKNKKEMFDDFLNLYAARWTERLFYDLKFDGDYSKKLNNKWQEKEVVGYYSNQNVNLLISGRIDSLYEIKKGIFVVRDNKSSKAVRIYDRDDKSYFELQIGGYAYLLKQLYNADVVTTGIIWYLHYDDFRPTYASIEGFAALLQRFCDFVRLQKAPIKHQPYVAICRPEYCSYFSLCYWHLVKKEVSE